MQMMSLLVSHLCKLLPLLSDCLLLREKNFFFFLDCLILNTPTTLKIVYTPACGSIWVLVTLNDADGRQAEVQSSYGTKWRDLSQ